MKLKNKKTDEIIDFDSITDTCFGSKIQLQSTERYNKPIYIYNSLAELNAVWEDYEEPKEYWYIYAGEPQRADCDGILEEDFKAIGNYFSTKEEAEKAVEKLKAWKRLKDKGFKFIGVRGIGKVIDFDIPAPFNHVGFDEYVAGEDEKEFYKDLLLLFGGEE